MELYTHPNRVADGRGDAVGLGLPLLAADVEEGEQQVVRVRQRRRQLHLYLVIKVGVPWVDKGVARRSEWGTAR